jgi:predicted glycogen debranching enzyme
MNDALRLEREWLEADGLGGFASGTVGLIRTRRYHGLLLAAAAPPSGRTMLVNGFEAHLVTQAGRFALSAQRYAPDVVHPDGAQRIAGFELAPWPRWRFELADGTAVEQEIFAVHGTPCVVVRFRLCEARPGVQLELRPLLSGRDQHALQRENAAFAFTVRGEGERLRLQPYPGVPAVLSSANARFEPAPDWYRGFLYAEEQARGLDALEDLAAPGLLRFDLSREPAAWILGADTPARDAVPAVQARELGALELATNLAERERERRARLGSPLQRAADAYLVARGAGGTIVAGYPWFGDWGRDTFIALRGLCLATGRLDEARAILLEWAGTVSRGMLPNRFAEHGAPEFNAVDASLWYVIAVHELLSTLADQGEWDAGLTATLQSACQAILEGYADGTRHGIAACADGLLAAGEPALALTWMDAKVNGRAVTPRIGKPVEVQALWINALAIGAHWSERWDGLHRRAMRSFGQRFWNDAAGGLYDVVDADHRPGACDASLRPNQIFAVGGLPWSALEGARARAVVDLVEARLLTPCGLRSLAPGEPGYAPAYGGGVQERDGAYHQGTVWPWLIGPFVEAWLRVRGDTEAARHEARRRFLAPLLAHAERDGFGHLHELHDAEPPFTARGCPFQAWSLGELLRLEHGVLATPSPAAGG